RLISATVGAPPGNWGSRAGMKKNKIFQVIRAAVVVGALVGALAAPGASAMAAARDSDHDGLTNSFEKNWSHTNPFRADSNHNGIRDGKENPDHDGLTNRQEQKMRQLGVVDNPLDADANDNGTTDGNGDEDNDHLDDQG